jgi:hypothetical protein
MGIEHDAFSPEGGWDLKYSHGWFEGTKWVDGPTWWQVGLGTGLLLLAGFWARQVPPRPAPREHHSADQSEPSRKRFRLGAASSLLPDSSPGKHKCPYSGHGRRNSGPDDLA